MPKELSEYNKFVKEFAKSHKGKGGKTMFRSAAKAWKKSGQKKQSLSPKKGSKKCAVGTRRTSLKKKDGTNSKRNKCQLTKKIEKLDKKMQILEEEIEEEEALGFNIRTKHRSFGKRK